MKDFRKEKGITLVALIITIVILLILAAVAIAAIQNENILSHANNAAIKYNSSVDREQGILGGYLDVLDKYTGNEWITIYEGDATTQDGIAVLGEGDLFSYGSYGVPYKITISSDEYSGPPVETVPIFAGNQEGTNIYLLFAVDNGEAIGFTSVEDADNKIANLGENAVAVAGISQAGMCGIMLEGATCEYTITKIERKSLGKPIFEGELALTTGGVAEELMPELQGILKYTRNYVFEVEINGETTLFNVRTSVSGWLDIISLYCFDYSNSSGFLISLNKNSIFCDIEGCILKKIYDVGPSTTYFEENGFTIVDNGGNLCLIKTPNTNYVVPETVAGKEINTVFMDCISGEPTFTKEVSLYAEVANMVTGNIKIISNNLDFWFEELSGNLEFLKLNVDLTECGDSIVFPQEYLDAGITTYVTSAVKANYADYDNIIAK